MIEHRRVFSDILRSLAASILVLMCASTLGGQVSTSGFASPPAIAGPSRPSAVPEGYVITPFGYYHLSCVHQVDEGGTILADGRVQHADGRVDASAPICSYPRYSPNGSVISQSQPMVENCTVDGAGWIESIGASASANTSYGKLSATWTVPPSPSSDDGQLLYLFPGFADCPNGASILQPVLQWGYAELPTGGIGGNYWQIVSWNAYGETGVYHGPPVRVSPGDTILGTISSTCKPGGNSCPTWNVVTVDKNTGGKSTLAGTLSNGQVWNLAFGGVLEAPYGVTQCSDYPANGNVVFNVHLYDENLKPISNPGWTANPADPGITPQCGFDLNPSATKETLFYDYGPGTIESLTCTSEPYGFLVTVKGTLQGPKGAAYTMTWADVNGNDWTDPFQSCSPWTLSNSWPFACTNKTGKSSKAKYVYEIPEFQSTNVTVTLKGGSNPVTASVSCP